MACATTVLYRAAKETLVEYFQKTSLNGFGLLYFIRRRKYQRLFWFMFIVVGMVFASYVVSYIVLDFLRNPTVTTLDSITYDVEKVPYPAVAVCSTNKLSRRAVKAFVQEMLASKEKHYKDTQRDDRDSQKELNYWLQKFTLFGGYFEHDAVDPQEAREFQQQLASLIGDNWTTRDLLKRLSPQCADLLLKCYWSNGEIACGAIFHMYATADGYCCVFNYKDFTASTHHPNGTGPETGLTLLLNTAVGDFYYTARNFHGFVVQIFEPSDTADSSTGGIEEIFIAQGQHVQLELSVVAQLAATEAHGYGVRQRNCYFTDEYVPNYGYVESDAKCLANCQMRRISELCDCVPYYAAGNYQQTLNGTAFECTLEHMPCLQRHHISWLTYRPSAKELPQSLAKDLPHSVRCTECLPSCSYNRYYSSKQAAQLADSKLPHKIRTFLANLSVSRADDVSVVQLYFPAPFATQYRKNVLYNWYQILSNIGGVIGISMGCSFISGFEVLYFLGVRLWQNFLALR